MSYSLIHRLNIELDQLPKRLNNPFDARVPEMVAQGVARVRELLCDLSVNRPSIDAELKLGKMLGILFVEDQEGKVGMLVGFSGLLAGESCLPHFVPPIFDLNSGYFREAEAEITTINQEIDSIENGEEYNRLKSKYLGVERSMKSQLAVAKGEYQRAKEERDNIRKECNDRAVIDRLNRESQFQKGELRRLKMRLEGELQEIGGDYFDLCGELEQLRNCRAELSYALQRRVFESYNVLNGRGEERSLFEIFRDSIDALPPAGAGECAAPKLLHYAYSHSLRPVAIGEFWVGASPRGEVRHDGEFYGACKSKCVPILNYMLQGIDCDRGGGCCDCGELRTIFEDDYLLVVSKPSGLLSVPGKGDQVSVESTIRERYRGLNCSIMVHRLDQDTSGVMVVAKSAEVHRLMQEQFASRSVGKCYIADVEGVVAVTEGVVRLPLSPDYMDRPRQMVDRQNGKEAVTKYCVEQCDGVRTRLRLSPLTGRTHQLRLHCAHVEGLGTPIVGDRLYGRAALHERRLHLHAYSIEFTHPITGERVYFEDFPPPFGSEWI